MKHTITIELTAKEIERILAGLLNEGYEYGKREEEEENRLVDAQIEDNNIAEEIARVKRDRAHTNKEAAYRAYNKIKKEAMRLGAIF